MPKLKDVKEEKKKPRTFICPECEERVYETGTGWACSKCSFFVFKGKYILRKEKKRKDALSVLFKGRR